MKPQKLKVGQTVFWNDPAGETSGYYKIVKTKLNSDPSVLLIEGIVHGEAEVFIHEVEVRAMKVIFRKLRCDGSIIALFPEVPWDPEENTVTSYMHVGQHGGANYQHIIAKTRPACEDEYRPLLAELKSIGYDDLHMMKRYRPRFNQSQILHP